MADDASDPIIRVRDVSVRFGATTVLDGLSLDVKRGEILGFVGPSGAGKSVLTRTIIGLVPKVGGSIEVFGVDLETANVTARRAVERRWGVLFQQGALFSSLNVRQNIQFPMREYLDVSQALLDEITVAKLGMVGLRPEVADRYPSELSGGMIKRVALARALALDPELVFLDEPTSGLDPIGAGDFDDLVRTLQRTLGLTVFMVTHDLDSLHTACDRIAVLGNGKIIAAGSMADMLASAPSWVKRDRSRFDGNAGEFRPDRIVHARSDRGSLRFRSLVPGPPYHQGAQPASYRVRRIGFGPAQRRQRELQRHPCR
jgi:phospholipid/cholesterol/gamma-HCH transport system ATP-binding protein